MWAFIVESKLLDRVGLLLSNHYINDDYSFRTITRIQVVHTLAQLALPTFPTMRKGLLCWISWKELSTANWPLPSGLRLQQEDRMLLYGTTYTTRLLSQEARQGKNSLYMSLTPLLRALHINVIIIMNPTLSWYIWYSSIWSQRKIYLHTFNNKCIRYL